MTRLRHTNLVNALFYLPRPAVVLVPLLLKGLTLIVTLGVTAWLRSTWVDRSDRLYPAAVECSAVCPGRGSAAHPGGDLVPKNHRHSGGADLGGGIGAASAAASLRGMSH